MTIAERMLTVFKRLHIEKVTLESNLDRDLSVDSQEVIYLITELENEFSIQLEQTDISRNMLVSEVLAVINTKLNNSSHGMCDNQ